MHGAGGFERAGTSYSGEGWTLMSLLAAFTRACIDAGGVRDDADGTWCKDAATMLVTAWVKLVGEDRTGSTG